MPEPGLGARPPESPGLEAAYGEVALQFAHDTRPVCGS